ncbi:MAG: T9SS type A sorting domain-containing protein [Flavobacteriia bacterium]|nr:T9SS type A sorting domain-containing protein [Flavobacteriia bacterium]
MKKIILSLSLYFLSSLSFSQTWNIGQQMCIGGLDFENIFGSFQLSTGNYLLYGTSKSGISGDKTEINYGNEDIWVVVINPNFQIIWQKTLGGNTNDVPSKIIETIDHNLIIVSSSGSDMNSIKTENSYGMSDVWVIKLDLSGNIIWDKTLGGTENDLGTDIIELESGNFLISSLSSSSISGTKSTPNIGLTDNWIIKLNAFGDVLMDQTIGGTDNETVFSINKVNSNKYLISSYSYSNISGNKTENAYGNSDYWLYFIDTNAVVLSDKTIGGLNYETNLATLILPSGEIIITGFSDSPISGLKTEDCFNFSIDCWILKLDSNLNIVNQKTIGGNKLDLPISINLLQNNELIIGILSDSDAGGYKTEPRIGISNKDQWFVKLDSDFNELDDKTIGTTGNEDLSNIIETSNNNFLIFGASNGALNNDKTCVGNGSSDYWVYKLDTNLGLDEIQNSNINTFPNPVKQELTIETEMDIDAIEIQNLEGKVVATFNQMNQLKTINVQNLITGIYLCKIKMITGQIEVIRFVKE